MAAITASDKVVGLAAGQTFTVNSQHGVLAGDNDAFGYERHRCQQSRLAFRGLGDRLGRYGTLMMHIDGKGWTGVPRILTAPFCPRAGESFSKPPV
jgi:hypothetical protein